MQQCIDTAQVHNKNLQMSRNNMAIGEQREKEAKANLIPKVTANADYKYFHKPSLSAFTSQCF
jgi:outer membrane protein TolC